MRIYRVKSGVVIEQNEKLYHVPNTSWIEFMNDDNLPKKAEYAAAQSSPLPNDNILKNEILPPIEQPQELWACGVTYMRSRAGRQEEQKEKAGGDFYARAYDAERPEIFMKATPRLVVGHGGKVNIRKDSSWDCPEPEITLVVTSSNKIIGYTIGNDMSSRSIEGENPLYLPQGKTYDNCAALGPGVLVTDKPLPKSTVITMVIKRAGKIVYEGNVGWDQMKRTPEELVAFVHRECSFPFGNLVMTGTGIVPSKDFTLNHGDEISITVEPIGTLVNTVN